MSFQRPRLRGGVASVVSSGAKSMLIDCAEVRRGRDQEDRERRIDRSAAWRSPHGKMDRPGRGSILLRSPRLSETLQQRTHRGRFRRVRLCNAVPIRSCSKYAPHRRLAYVLERHRWPSAEPRACLPVVGASDLMLFLVRLSGLERNAASAVGPNSSSLELRASDAGSPAPAVINPEHGECGRPPMQETLVWSR